MSEFNEIVPVEQNPYLVDLNAVYRQYGMEPEDANYTFAEELKEVSKMEGEEFDPSQIPAGPANQKFEYLSIDEISKDKKHAVATTEEGPYRFVHGVLRDGKLLMRMNAPLRIATTTENLDKILVVDQAPLNNDEKIERGLASINLEKAYLIDQEDHITEIMTAAEREYPELNQPGLYFMGANQDLSTFLFAQLYRTGEPSRMPMPIRAYFGKSAYIDGMNKINRTRLQSVDQNGQVLNTLDIGGFYFRPIIHFSNDDMLNVIWEGQGPTPSMRSLFHNDTRLTTTREVYDEIKLIGTNPDFSRVLFLTQSKGSYKSSIHINNKEVFNGRNIEFGKTFINEDATLAAVEVIDKNGKRRLFGISGDKTGFIGNGFDQIKELGEKDGKIYAVAISSGNEVSFN